MRIGAGHRLVPEFRPLARAEALDGRHAGTKAIPMHWHNTPNIHFCTISISSTLPRSSTSTSCAPSRSTATAGRNLARLASLYNMFGEQGMFLLQKR